jgi:hypothetical protein
MITAKGWIEEVQTMTIEELCDVMRRNLTCAEAKQVIRDELLMRFALKELR